MPRGWWHCVLNLEPSIAVTQNYVPPSALSRVLRFLRDRPDQVSGLSTKEERSNLHEEFRAALYADERWGGREALLAADAAERTASTTQWERIKQRNMAADITEGSVDTGTISGRDDKNESSGFAFSFF